MRNNLTVQIAGEGGEGVIATGELFSFVVARTKHDIFTFRTYPAEIKGGPAMFQIRFADHPVLSAGIRLDVLLAYNQEASDLHSGELKDDGFMIYDSTLFDPEGEVGPNVHLYGVPMTKIATEEIKQKRSKNMVGLGVLGALFGFQLDAIIPLLESKFGGKGEKVLQSNIQALEAGFKWVADHSIGDTLYVKSSAREDVKVLMSGNEALSMGALAAGCRYYAGYPITPASEILKTMETHLPKFGGVAIQTEDEISAVCSTIGASYSGIKAMTATSGPGFSLMAESLGLASMTEIPIVIVDVQRGGPSTGLPTKTEQSDLMSAIFSSHGEAPRVVLAPSNVKDCFHSMVRAFYISEKYQIPVIVLSDQSLSHRTQTFTKPKLETLTVVNRLKAMKNGKLERYLDTENGVSPVSYPGEEGMSYVATGLEHDEGGRPSWSPKNHQHMSEKRHRKLQFIAKETGFVRRFGEVDSAVGVICWGSTEGPVEEALHLASMEGLEVKALTIKMLHPLPSDEIRTFLNGLKIILVPELNYTGQLCQILRGHFKSNFESFTQCSGLRFSPADIFERIKEAVARV